MRPVQLVFSPDFLFGKDSYAMGTSQDQLSLKAMSVFERLQIREKQIWC